MTAEEVERLLRQPGATPFWPSSKPGVTAAMEAVTRAERSARTALLADHRRHFAALRLAVEEACGADGGHDVEQVPGDVASFGDRWCASCRRRFPRWAALGRSPSKCGDTGEPHDHTACTGENGK